MIKLLIVDDTLENRTAALTAEPTASLASSARQARELLASNNYDFVITDLDMEKTLSGLEVVTAALAKGIPAYTASNSGRGHTGETVKLNPYDFRPSIPYTGKSDPIYWRQAIDSILNCTSDSPQVQKQYHDTIRFIGNASMDEHLLFVAYVGNNTSILEKLREEEQEGK